jgi:ribosomal protein S18 acetylase RimI-like enzyme
LRVRQLTAEDLPALKAIRLRALQDAPEAYGSTYEGTVTRTDDEWRAWFESVTPFIAEGADGASIGLAATYRDEQEPAVAHLTSMWVAPEARGTGIGDALVQQVVRYATAQGAAAVRLDVVEGNAPAIKLYERNGFTLTGRQINRERDGAIELEMEFRRRKS